MKTIVSGKRSSVFYDSKKDIFIKKFTPKFITKLKFFFKLRKYPGKNYAYISSILNELNIKTASIVESGNYYVITKNVQGISLEEYYKSNPSIIENYISLITTIFKHNIYCGDLSLDNFLVKDDEIYVIDMEDYRYSKFVKRGTKEALRRLSGKIPSDIFEKIRKNIED